MERQDRGLAFMLQYENIAWYEKGAVRILDRRVYPRRVEFVTCRRHEEVAQAVTDMVTQSAGPYTAAAMGMALAAYECRTLAEAQQTAYLEQAARVIANARPTTAARMRLVTEGSLAAAKKALAAGQDTSAAIVEYAVAANDVRYAKVGRMAEYLVDMIPAGGTVMTLWQQRAASPSGCSARKRGRIFQGARLTATVAHEMGFDVTVITDNMPAYVMQREHVDVFTSAADAICLDGHVVNKVGTFQIAIAAKYMEIPYFVTGAPDHGHPTVDTVRIELRDPDFVLQAMGVKTACDGVKGYYPAFDITPPALVSGVVTDSGIYAPYDLSRYFKSGNPGEYGMVV